MITKFSTLYTGHIELEAQGFDGPPVNTRHYSNDHLRRAFDTAAAIAAACDRLGFHTLWLAEHHFQREGYECIPNILMLAVHLARQTMRVRFGCGFNIVPIWHPLRLAEDYAVADILTEGRVRFGVGRGYHAREVETFGAPLSDQESNRELFEEQVDIILKALHQPAFKHAGKHYTIPPRIPYRGYELADVTLVPRPAHLPVECWQPIVSGNARGLAFMASRGIKGFIGGGAALTASKGSLVSAWREELARHGRDTVLGGDLILGLNVFVCDSEREATAILSPSLEEHQKLFGPLGFLGPLTSEQLANLANPATARRVGLPTVRDLMRSGGWIVGPPDRIVARLREIEEMYPGLDEIMVGHPVGLPRATIEQQLAAFAGEVMPAMASRRQPAVPLPAQPHPA